MTRISLLLPARERFGGQRFSADVAAALGRGRRWAGEPGRHAQLARHVQLPPGRWPIAALTRQVDAADAAGAAWLRADPAWLRPDINSVRLMAHGQGMQLSRDDCQALLPALRPLFDDAGFRLDAPVPSRWYLRLTADTPLPDFAEPGDVLGDDLIEHLDDAGPQGRRWRALANEAQIVLHNHPWNAQRDGRGLPPVNALWFWGGGGLPDAHTRAYSRHSSIHSGDPTLHALAAVSTMAYGLPVRLPGVDGDDAFDMADCHDLQRLGEDWLRPALAAFGRGHIQALELDAADGWGLELGRMDQLRFWRRPLVHWGS